MGGHGALICFLKNPGRYASVSAFSPICHPTACPWGQKAFSGYLGDDRQVWKVNAAETRLQYINLLNDKIKVWICTSKWDSLENGGDILMLYILFLKLYYTVDRYILFQAQGPENTCTYISCVHIIYDDIIMTRIELFLHFTAQNALWCICHPAYVFICNACQLELVDILMLENVNKLQCSFTFLNIKMLANSSLPAF